jgi:hypothetical protein
MVRDVLVPVVRLGDQQIGIRRCRARHPRRINGRDHAGLRTATFALLAVRATAEPFSAGLACYGLAAI